MGHFKLCYYTSFTHMHIRNSTTHTKIATSDPQTGTNRHEHTQTHTTHIIILESYRPYHEMQCFLMRDQQSEICGVQNHVCTYLQLRLFESVNKSVCLIWNATIQMECNLTAWLHNIPKNLTPFTEDVLVSISTFEISFFEIFENDQCLKKSNATPFDMFFPYGESDVFPSFLPGICPNSKKNHFFRQSKFHFLRWKKSSIHQQRRYLTVLTIQIPFSRKSHSHS